MSAPARSDSKAWSQGNLATLRQLVRLELPMRVIARKLERPELAVRQKAHHMAMAEIYSSFDLSNQIGPTINRMASGPR